MHVVDGRSCGAASLHAPGVGTAQPFEHGDNIAACHIETHPGIGLVGDRGAGAERGGQGRGVDPFNQILVRPHPDRAGVVGTPAMARSMAHSMTGGRQFSKPACSCLFEGGALAFQHGKRCHHRITDLTDAVAANGLVERDRAAKRGCRGQASHGAALPRGR